MQRVAGQMRQIHGKKWIFRFNVPKELVFY